MSSDVSDLVAGALRNVPDFPKPGILFKDVSPLYADARVMRVVLDAITEPIRVENAHVDLVAGVEARGFVLAAALATDLGCGTVMVRKAGKLPPPTLHRAYELEYGTAEMELPADIVAGKQVLLVDDVLATGGTMRAAADLVVEAGATLVGLAVLFEIATLDGRSALDGLPELHALLTD